MCLKILSGYESLTEKSTFYSYRVRFYLTDKGKEDRPIELQVNDLKHNESLKVLKLDHQRGEFAIFTMSSKLSKLRMSATHPLCLLCDQETASEITSVYTAWLSLAT